MEKLIVASEKLTIQEHIYAVEEEFFQKLVVEPGDAVHKPTIQLPINAASLDKFSLESTVRVQNDQEIRYHKYITRQILKI